MRILVIGGTRFLGRFIVQELLRRGHEVVVFHRGESEPHAAPDDLPEPEHLHGDRRDTAALTAALARTFDAVVDVDARNNVNSSALMRLAAGKVERVLFISSLHVYSGVHDGASQPIPFDELGTPLREAPLYPYRGHGTGLDDFDAVLLERGAFSHGPDASPKPTCLRVPVVYGPRDYFAREYPWIFAARNERPALIMGGGAAWLQQRVYAPDVALAVALALETPATAGQIFNVGEWQVRTMAQLALDVCRLLGHDPALVIVPDALLPPHLQYLALHQQHIWADTRRFRELTRYAEPLSHDERLQRTIAWHLEHPPAENAWPVPDYDAEDEVLNAFLSDADGSGEA